MAANGNFFPSGPPHHHPPGAGAPPFSPPPGQTGFFMPGGQRPESTETTWAESGKPPRRRKKVRKPFQRWNLLMVSKSNTGKQQITAMFVSRLLLACHDLNWRRFTWVRCGQIRQSRERHWRVMCELKYHRRAEKVAVMVLYLSFTLFLLVSKMAVALALKSYQGCCNEPFLFHNFLPKSFIAWFIHLHFNFSVLSCLFMFHSCQLQAEWQFRRGLQALGLWFYWWSWMKKI